MKNKLLYLFFCIIIIFCYLILNTGGFSFLQFNSTKADETEELLKHTLPVFIQNMDLETSQKTFRNPFKDYRPRTAEDDAEEKNDLSDLSPEAARQNIPFILKGIVSYNQQDIALISFDGQSRILKKGKMIEGFEITSIQEKTITITRLQDQKSLKMKIGGGLIEE